MIKKQLFFSLMITTFCLIAATSCMKKEIERDPAASFKRFADNLAKKLSETQSKLGGSHCSNLLTTISGIVTNRVETQQVGNKSTPFGNVVFETQFSGETQKGKATLDFACVVACVAENGKWKYQDFSFGALGENKPLSYEGGSAKELLFHCVMDNFQDWITNAVGLVDQK